jgi:hypothetical protein
MRSGESQAPEMAVAAEQERADFMRLNDGLTP